MAVLRPVELPVGVVTLLFSDIEGSTRLLHELGDRFGELLADHDRLLRAVWLKHHGVEVKTEGDAFFVAFADAGEGVRAAVEAQRVLGAQGWPLGGEVRVRIGLHTGSPRIRGNDYWGIDVHYAARLCEAAHGGQVLVSESTVSLVDAEVEDLGRHALKDFPAARRIFHLPIDGRSSDCFPPLRTLRVGRTNLPDQVSSFVGRERQLAELRDLLRDARVVTLTGAGGVGKTRLALEVGSELLDGSGDGVWFVDLAPLSDPELVAATVARVLAVAEQPGRSALEVLVDALGEQKLLIVLDNCEHLIAAAAALVDGLVTRCRELVILATSREPLRVPGERVYRVPSLSTPDGEERDPKGLAASEAVRLFVERAAQHRPGFVLEPENATRVGRVVRRLDGIPLAIELATGRLRSLSLTDLDARLDHRFALLRGGSRTALPRQQTLQALIDWSYELLLEPERIVLERLSVFAGGCGLDAAESVCCGGIVERSDVVDLLGALVDKSVVHADDSAGSVRYRLLDTVREYAAAKLGERGNPGLAGVRRAHRDHYLALAEAALPELIGHDQLAWLDCLDAEHDNLRSALSVCLQDPNPEPGLRLASAVGQFRLDRGHAIECAAALEVQLARPEAREPTPARARALVTAAKNLVFNISDYPAAIAACEEALEIARYEHDDRLLAEALLVLSTTYWRQGKLAEALDLVDEGLALARTVGDVHLIARVLYRRGVVLGGSGQDNRRVLDEAAGLYRESGDRVGVATVIHGVGCFELEVGDLQSARVHLEEALGVFRELRIPRRAALALFNLGRAAVLNGDESTARRSLAEALDQARSLGDLELVALALVALAQITTGTGDADNATTLYGAAEALLDRLGEPLEASEARRRDADHEHLRTLLGATRFAAARQAGRTLTLTEATSFALNLASPQTPAAG